MKKISIFLALLVSVAICQAGTIYKQDLSNSSPSSDQAGNNPITDDSQVTSMVDGEIITGGSSGTPATNGDYSITLDGTADYYIFNESGDAGFKYIDGDYTFETGSISFTSGGTPYTGTIKLYCNVNSGNEFFSINSVELVEDDGNGDVYVDIDFNFYADIGGNDNFFLTLDFGANDTVNLAIEDLVGVAGTNDVTGSGVYRHYFIKTPDPVSVEAEAMTLDGFNTESQAAASGGQVVVLSGTSGFVTTTVAELGNYDIETIYFDENDGAAVYKLYLDNALVDAWSANRDLGNANPVAGNLVTHHTKDVFINAGQTLELFAYSEGSEPCRLDKIVLKPAAAGGSNTMTWNSDGTFAGLLLRGGECLSAQTGKSQLRIFNGDSIAAWSMINATEAHGVVKVVDQDLGRSEMYFRIDEHDNHMLFRLIGFKGVPKYDNSLNVRATLPISSAVNVVVIDDNAKADVSGSQLRFDWNKLDQRDYFPGGAFALYKPGTTAENNAAIQEIEALYGGSAPIADSQDVSVDEDDTVAITLTATDPNGDSMTYSVVTGPSNGALSGTSPNLTYTPNAEYSGSDSFTFIANDGINDSLEATVLITVNPIDDPPVFGVPTASAAIAAGGSYSSSLAGSATDDGAGAVTYAILSGPAWLTLDPDGVTLTGSPTGSDLGANSWTIEVTDDTGNKVQTTLNITVVDSVLIGYDFNAGASNLSDPTVTAAGVTASQFTSPMAIAYVSTIGDNTGLDAAGVAFGDAGTLGCVGVQTIDAITGNFADAVTGQDYMTFTLTPDAGVTLTLNTLAFKVSKSVNTSVDEYVVTDSSDNPIGNAVIITAINGQTAAYDGVTVNLTGTAFESITSATEFRIYAWGRGTGSASGTLAMLDKVTLHGKSSAPTADDKQANFTTGGSVAVTLSGSDPDGDSLTYSIVDAPNHGTLSGTEPNLTYTHDGGGSGYDSFTYVVNDGLVDSAPATVTLIGSGMVAHWKMDDGSGTVVSDDTSNGFDGTLTGGVWLGSGGVIDGALEFNGSVSNDTVSIPGGLFNTVSDEITISMWVYGDSAEQPRSDAVFVAKDLNGARLFGIHLPWSDGNVYWDAGNSTGYDRIRKLATPADYEGQWNHWVFTKDAVSGTMGIYLNGVLWHSSASGSTKSMTTTVASARLGSDVGALYYDGSLDDVRIYNTALNSTEIAALYSSVNDVPVADAQSVSLNEDDSVAITLSGSDAIGYDLTYSVASQPSNGTLSGTAPNLTYTPDANYNGADSFTFTVNDGAVDSPAATVSITVDPVDDAPIADDASVTVTEDTPQGITLTGSDGDGDSLTYVVTSQPTNGTLSGTGANLTYTPDADYHGSDTFTFTVDDGTVATLYEAEDAVYSSSSVKPHAGASGGDYLDGNGGFNVTWTVNHAGGDVQLDFQMKIPSGSPRVMGVFIDNTQVGVVSSSSTSWEVVSLPVTLSAGTNTIELRDSEGTSEPDVDYMYVPLQEGVITITVDPANDAPVADAQSVSVIGNSPKAVTLTGTDIDGDSIVGYTVVAGPTNGVLSGTAPNLTYTPNTDYVGADSFTFTVNDGTVDSAVATVTIDVLTPISIALVGNGSGYDATNVRAFRSTGVAKQFDADGDDAYGTEGLFFFGDGMPNNGGGNGFIYTKVGAAWATFSSGANFVSVAEGGTFSYALIDDPALPIAAAVTDWGIRSGIAVANTVAGAGSWNEVVTFEIDATTPQRFRIGLMNSNADHVNWNSAGLRISADGGTPVAVTGLPGTVGQANWVFFDINLNGRTSGTFSIEGQRRSASQGASLGGVTFDVITVYSAWVSGYGLTGNDALADADTGDGDGISNIVEAWFGTDPTVYSSAGISLVATDQTISTFSHPQNSNIPFDLTGSYEWSTNLVDWYACDGVDGPVAGPTMTASPNTVGTTTTVTTTASEAMDRVFIRANVQQN